MQPAWQFLRIIGAAVLQHGRDQLPKRYLHRVLPEVAQTVWNEWGQRVDEETRIQTLSATARAMGKIRPYVEMVVDDIAPNQPETVRKPLLTYLSVIPSSIRIALRRPNDPKGLSVPHWLVPREADDLLIFMPSSVPVFEPGAKPLPDVDWELTDLLGVGGFGEVWKAQNPTFSSVPPVVLKFCLDPKGSNRAFRHEAAILTQAMPNKPHPGIVELRATYMNHNPPCLEFEYISGGDLIQWFKGRKREHGPLDARKATWIVHRLARIVGYFHTRKPPIVHRDLKPANILVRRVGRRMEFKICDFGIGGLASSEPSGVMEEITSRRLIKRSAMKGYHTKDYASPQQIKGGPPDPRDDVHALGVIWFQLLMNDLRLPAPTGLDWIEDLAHHGFNREQLELISSCFQSRADLRPPNARVLAQEIAQRFRSILQPNGGKHSPRSRSTVAAKSSLSRATPPPNGPAQGESPSKGGLFSRFFSK